MQLLVPVLAALLGGAVYLAPSGKFQQLGLVTFGVGMLWLIYGFAHATVRFG